MDVNVPNNDVIKVSLSSHTEKLIIIFGGGFKDETNSQELFTADEYEFVIFSEFQIYKTDSIKDIKLKISKTLNDHSRKFPKTRGDSRRIFSSFPERSEGQTDDIYLFTTTLKKNHIENVYIQVTNNDENTLSKKMFSQFLTNYHLSTETKTQLDEIAGENSISFETFASILVDNTNISQENTIFIPLGYKKIDDPFFVVNPLYITESHILSKKPQQFDINENSILLSYPHDNSNQLFFCLKYDFINDDRYDEDVKTYISKTYFPTNDKENEEKTNTFKIQDMFHHIYYTKTSELPYITKGIENLYITILNENNKNLIFPIDDIFKNIHATVNMPYVRFNPRIQDEAIYRLYSKYISKNGKTIPLLKMNEIKTITNKMGTQSYSISSYIIVQFNKSTIELFVELYKDGSITIQTESKYYPLQIDEWNSIIKTGLNPLITAINTFISSSGFKFRTFKTIQEERIDSLKLAFSIYVTEKISILEDLFCLTNIFDVYNHQLANDSNIDMRFKLVQGFDIKMAQISLLKFIHNNNDEDNDIRKIDILMDNYHIDLNNAKKISQQYELNEMDIIPENNGFLTTFELEDKKLTVTVNDIDSLHYIKELEIYIDCIIRISQKKQFLKSYTYSKKKILQFCQKKHDTNKINYYDNNNNNDMDKGDDEFDETDFDNFNMGTYNNEDQESEGEDQESEEEEQESEGEVQDSENFNSSNNLSLTNMNITSYFIKRLKRRDKKLFTEQNSNAYTSYSRMCPENNKRQPVIINNEEKERIDRESRGSYTTALKHGSSDDPAQHNWFICPRYWCIKTDTSLTEDDVKSGKCGGVESIIDEKTKYLPHGKNIYQFDHALQHRRGNDASYVWNTPGFLKKTNMNGKAMPCCFKKSTIVEKNVDIDSNIDNKYISGFQTSPIDIGRWGFLPFSVQKILNTDQSLAQSKKNPSNILQNVTCYLRYGIEKSTNQSFIAYIAELYAYKHKKSVPLISEMKQILKKAISLDLFVKYQNASLVSIFNDNRKHNHTEQIDNKYKDSSLYKSLDLSKDNNKIVLLEAISSYENFFKFIDDDNSIIEHTYLWDAIVDANPHLMINGINLILLESIDNDTTDNISIVCPTNFNFSQFDAKKEYFIVLKNGQYYEPIYQYQDTVSKLIISKGFMESKASENIKKSINDFKKISKLCSPTNSKKENVYSFSRNLSAQQIIEKLIGGNFQVKSQVVNYKFKCIGILTNEVMVPCYPSSINNDIQIKYMDDPSIFNTAKKTYKELMYIKIKTQIPCQPKILIQEDKLFVGLLTETNQFVQFSSVEDTITFDNSMSTIDDSNHLIADVTAMTSRNEDQTRINMVKSISVEQQFYLAFRTITRLLINSYEKRVLKKEILELTTKESRAKNTHKTLLTKCISKLEILLDGHVSFDSINNDVIQTFVNITGCNEDNVSNYCIFRDNKHVLIIPQENLINGFDNKKLYFAKMADELIRNRRSQLFMFDSKRFINLPNTQFSVNHNELLIVDSLLNDFYFKNLVPFNLNTHTKNITYDIAEPSFNKNNKVFQKKLFNMNNVIANNPHTSPELDETCYRKVNVIGNNSSKFIFQEAQEYVINNNKNDCTFYVLKYIMMNFKKKNVSTAQIKETLIIGYSKLKSYENHIIAILKAQHKVITEEMSLKEFILSNDYSISELDLWVYAIEENLPILLFSSNNIAMMNGRNTIFLSGVHDDLNTKELFFVRASSNSRQISFIDKPFKHTDVAIHSEIREKIDNQISIIDCFKKIVLIKLVQ
jgi:hypothetical protein